MDATLFGDNLICDMPVDEAGVEPSWLTEWSPDWSSGSEVEFENLRLLSTSPDVSGPILWCPSLLSLLSLPHPFLPATRQSMSWCGGGVIPPEVAFRRIISPHISISCGVCPWHSCVAVEMVLRAPHTHTL
jgi:hypothetical protein